MAAAITARRFARCIVGGSAAVAGTATAELLDADRFAAAARAACIAHVTAVPSKPPGYSISSIATPPPNASSKWNKIKITTQSAGTAIEPGRY